MSHHHGTYDLRNIPDNRLYQNDCRYQTYDRKKPWPDHQGNCNDRNNENCILPKNTTRHQLLDALHGINEWATLVTTSMKVIQWDIVGYAKNPNGEIDHRRPFHKMPNPNKTIDKILGVFGESTRSQIDFILSTVPDLENKTALNFDKNGMIAHYIPSAKASNALAATPPLSQSSNTDLTPGSECTTRGRKVSQQKGYVQNKFDGNARSFDESHPWSRRHNNSQFNPIVQTQNQCNASSIAQYADGASKKISRKRSYQESHNILSDTSSSDGASLYDQKSSLISLSPATNRPKITAAHVDSSVEDCLADDTNRRLSSLNHFEKRGQHCENISVQQREFHQSSSCNHTDNHRVDDVISNGDYHHHNRYVTSSGKNIQPIQPSFMMKDNTPPSLERKNTKYEKDLSFFQKYRGNTNEPYIDRWFSGEGGSKNEILKQEDTQRISKNSNTRVYHEDKNRWHYYEHEERFNNSSEADIRYILCVKFMAKLCVESELTGFPAFSAENDLIGFYCQKASKGFSCNRSGTQQEYYLEFKPTSSVLSRNDSGIGLEEIKKCQMLLGQELKVLEKGNTNNDISRENTSHFPRLRRLYDSHDHGGSVSNFMDFAMVHNWI